MVKSEKRGMRVKKIKFIKDEKAVSTIIGTLLMFAIFVGIYGAYQSTAVPIWNKGVEYDHLDVVYSDMMSLKSDIEDVALLKSPKSSDIHLGVQYPERMIFMNPSEGAAGMLTVESGVEIVVEYSIDVAGTLTSHPKTFNSSRITYESYGTINSPKLVYEHGILIRDFRTSNNTADDQSLIVGNNIYIPLVNASASSVKSSLDVESLDIYPYTQTGTRTVIESVNITMDTEYPAIWKELLAGLNTSHLNVSVSLEDNKIIINHTDPMKMSFPAGNTTGAINAGIISVIATESYSPFITDIAIKEMSDTDYSNITATVKNVTAGYDIHADLVDLTKDSSDYDVLPDHSFNESYPIDAISWELPNNVTVRWAEIDHTGVVATHDVVTIGFRVYNSENGIEYSILKTFYRQATGKWR
jgi:FlaG/FlaF family flagellin (archaellin)